MRLHSCFKIILTFLAAILLSLFAGCNDATPKTEITVASYNVRRFSNCSFEEIAQEIKTINPDIIGFQELDNITYRSGYVDQLQEIAQICGYPYYYFSKISEYSDCGEYGHGIMSKYPILNSETTYFEIQYNENRCFSRSIIKVNNKKIAFYNIHIEYLGEIQVEQILELLEAAKRDKNVIITGDMNCSPVLYNYYIDNKKMISLNGGEDGFDLVDTFPAGDVSTAPIDNIIVSKSFDYNIDENNSALKVSKTDYSDHNMVYAQLAF